MPESNTLRIEEIKSRLSTIELEKKQLLQELKVLSEISEPNGSYGTLACDNPLTTSDERIALFTRLFRCRENVFPKLWENKQKGTKGYSPVCQEEWVPGICKKPNIKCNYCPNRKFVPLNESIIRSHLEGKITIGTYTLREDDSCIFLAADFDKKEWQYDAMAYKESAKKLGIEVSIERSRSGNGAHAWIFFSQPVAARIARQLGTIILTNAIAERHHIGFDSYDRFFPISSANVTSYVNGTVFDLGIPIIPS